MPPAVRPFEKKERDESSAWATPVVVKTGSVTQLVTNAKKRVRSYDLKTGELIWECGGQVSNVTPSPVVLENTVYCASGYRGSSLQALPLNQTGDFSGSEKILWQLKAGTPYVPSLLLFKGTLYFNRSNDAMISAVDAKSGKVIIDRSRLNGLRRIYASPVAAKDRVYFVGRQGKTVVLRHGQGEQADVIATNQLDDRIDASPAIAGDQLFLRGRRFLYCIRKEP